jgi:hypothetical protein
MSLKKHIKPEIKVVKDKFGVVSSAPPPKPQQIVKAPVIKGNK